MKTGNTTRGRFLCLVLRYIHQNPVKANITSHPGVYSWSSYHQYLFSYNDQETLLDDDMARAYFANEKDFEEFMDISVSEEFLEYDSSGKITDHKLRVYIESQVPIEEFSKFTIEERNLKIREIYSNTGASIRQLSNVLEIGKAVIERAIRENYEWMRQAKRPSVLLNFPLRNGYCYLK